MGTMATRSADPDRRRRYVAPAQERLAREDYGVALHFATIGLQRTESTRRHFLFRGMHFAAAGISRPLIGEAWRSERTVMFRHRRSAGIVPTLCFGAAQAQQLADNHKPTLTTVAWNRDIQ
jgi:hypothetical protein